MAEAQESSGQLSPEMRKVQEKVAAKKAEIQQQQEVLVDAFPTYRKAIINQSGSKQEVRNDLLEKNTFTVGDKEYLAVKFSGGGNIEIRTTQKEKDEALKHTSLMLAHTGEVTESITIVDANGNFIVNEHYPFSDQYDMADQTLERMKRFTDQIAPLLVTNT